MPWFRPFRGGKNTVDRCCLSRGYGREPSRKGDQIAESLPGLQFVNARSHHFPGDGDARPVDRNEDYVARLQPNIVCNRSVKQVFVQVDGCDKVLSASYLDSAKVPEF